MLFEMSWLSAIFTKHSGKVKQNITIQKVTTDSRLETSQALFIPLVGDHFDGHDHVKQAIDNGAVAIIWAEDRQLSSDIPDDFPVFYVSDTLIALQQLAMHYRDEINPTVVGITGSNGKTTTKDLVAAITSTTYKTHATKGNFNNHIGMPLTILSMPNNTEVLILEMGMNDFKEIERLSEIAKPDYGIITNIGESHIEFLGSRKGIAQAKLEIMHGMNENGMMIIDGDEELLGSYHLLENVITCGFSAQNKRVITDVELFYQETTFTLKDTCHFSVPLLGRHHAQNAAYAITLANQLQISKEMIHKGLKHLALTGMRFELLQGKNGASIINDAYNASPTSMKAAIEVVKEMKGFKEKILVLGDIFELGKQSELLHQSVADVVEAPITAVFTCGDAAINISDSVCKQQPDIISRHFTTKEELITHLKKYMRPDVLLLFKASRGMKFETIIEDMLEKNN